MTTILEIKDSIIPERNGVYIRKLKKIPIYGMRNIIISEATIPEWVKVPTVEEIHASMNC